MIGKSLQAAAPLVRRGFSLVELLVVLGVITLLMGILLPALSSARKSARQLQCTGNLRQWAVALQLYAGSNNGYLPRRGQGVEAVSQINRSTDWFNALPPLMGMQTYEALAAAGQMPSGGIWMCPEATDATSGYAFSYGMNMWLSTWNAPAPDRMDRLENPATQVFMADGPNGHCSTLPGNAPYTPIARHLKSVNIAFVDGHVASFERDYVGCGVGDPMHPDVRWVVPGSLWGGPH